MCSHRTCFPFLRYMASRKYIRKQKGRVAMRNRFSIVLLILLSVFISACATHMSQETIFCDPPQALIYWGKTKGSLEKTGLTTPHSRSISASKFESWCYQVKKEGYYDSEITCRREESFRYLDFKLTPLQTSITSEPPGAIVYWGPKKDQLEMTDYRTPSTVSSRDPPAASGAAWADWYFQVKKEGYRDSEIVFLPRQQHDREIHFVLTPVKR
jgi:hypothetical protein